MAPPVHLLAGDNDLLLQRALERTLADLRSESADADVEVRDVSETAHLPELRTASLFGGRKVVVLRGAENLAGDLKAEVEDYLAAPSNDAVLVLVARGVGKIVKIAKLAKQRGARSDVKQPADWDQRGWQRLVTDEFRRHGRKPEAAAVAALLTHAGNDPATIATQAAQVVAATDASRPVGVADVERVVEGHGRRSGFAVADAVADRDPAAAMVALRGALAAGDAPLALLGAVVYRTRQLLQVAAGAGAGEMGVSNGQHRRLEGLVRNFSPGELAWCHDRLAQLDVDLKGSELPAPLLLEVAVAEVASPRAVESRPRSLSGPASSR